MENPSGSCATGQTRSSCCRQDDRRRAGRRAHRGRVGQAPARRRRGRPAICSSLPLVRRHRGRPHRLLPDRARRSHLRPRDHAAVGRRLRRRRRRATRRSSTRSPFSLARSLLVSRGARSACPAPAIASSCSWSPTWRSGSLLDFIKPASRIGGLTAIQWVVPGHARATTRRTCRGCVGGGARVAERVRPYLFYDVAVSICSTCYRKVEGKIVFQDGRVYMLKRCPSTAASACCIADDVDYYRRCREVFIKPPEMPLALQHAGPLGLPVRLRPLHRPRAALVPVADRDHRPLQPALPDLLRRAAARRGQRYRIARSRSSACSTRSCATRASPTSCRSPAASRRSTRTSSPSSTAPRRAPIRHLMVNTNGIRIANDEAFAERLADVHARTSRSTCSSTRSSGDALIDAARRRPARRPRARARAAQRARHLDDAGRDAQEGAQRRRDRPDHRLRAGAAAACAASRSSRSRRPAGSKQFDPATDRLTLTEVRRRILEQTSVFRPEDVHPGAVPPRQPGDGLRAEARRPGRAADRADRSRRS